MSIRWLSHGAPGRDKEVGKRASWEDGEGGGGGGWGGAMGGVVNELQVLIKCHGGGCRIYPTLRGREQDACRLRASAKLNRYANHKALTHVSIRRIY